MYLAPCTLVLPWMPYCSYSGYAFYNNTVVLQYLVPCSRHQATWKTKDPNSDELGTIVPGTAAVPVVVNLSMRQQAITPPTPNLRLPP
jgi:hypothetical protein